MQKIKQLWQVSVQLIVFFACVIVMIACTATNNRPAATSTPYVKVASKGVFYRSFAELMENSHIVIIARVVSKEQVVNTARNTLDHSKPSDNLFAIGQIYKLEIEQYIKGEGEKEMLIVQNQGIISTEQFQGERPSDAMIEQVIAQNKGKEYIPPTINTCYLMFLHAPIDTGYAVDGYPVEMLYNTPLRPWLFEITDKNLVLLISEVTDLSQYFPPRTLEDVILELNQPQNSTPAYP